ncbi:MAG TPA: cytochrome c biogenesis protein CcdA [Candidatus Paceibacterota bacterium]
MTFLLISFVAGVLTVLAPCVLPLLPVIVGGSLADTRSRWKPYVITASLAVSVVVFTLLLKASTYFIDIPQSFWQYFSGTILIFFGLITLFPTLWERGALKWNLYMSRKSNTLLAEGVKKESFWGDIVIGASLGPVFSSCSPTYFVILATVLPQSFAKGLVDLIAYAIGLSLALLLVALIGQKLVGKLGWVSDTHGWFKRSLGVLFLLVGVFIITGADKKLQTYLLSQGFFDITKVEQTLLKADEKPMPTIPEVIELSTGAISVPVSTSSVPSSPSVSPVTAKSTKLSVQAKSILYPKYVEIVNPAGFVNSAPFKLADLVGKKVILLDMMTYSCINCQRTYPYLAAWYKKYKDMGLEIVAIHTPEFAFEHKKENVQAAFKKFGLTFPAVLDNDYATWNAYQNNAWPHKYLIDIDGFIRFDHIGEGAYEETESKIKELLAERAEKLGEQTPTNGNVSASVPSEVVDAQSREAYFGAFRNAQFFGNGDGGKAYENSFAIPSSLVANKFYLGGKWKIEEQYIESGGEAELAFSYDAMKVYLVAEAPNGGRIQMQNKVQGQEDVMNVSSIPIQSATLYPIIDNKERKSGVFHIKADKGVRLYALTFG